MLKNHKENIKKLNFFIVIPSSIKSKDHIFANQTPLPF